MGTASAGAERGAAPRPWAGLAPRLALAGLGLFVLGGALGLTRLVTGLPAFGVAMAGAGLSLIALLVALLATLRGRRAQGARAALVAIIAPAVVVAAWLGHGQAPRINEATTDLLDPPPILDAPATPPEIAAVHAHAYADLAPWLREAPADVTFGRIAEALGGHADLTLVAVDHERRLVHAIAQSGVFGFVDDVTVRVTPHGRAGSRVDLRSRSREGRSDFGVNARRIRGLLAALQALAGAEDHD